MKIALFVIGNEILRGKRRDKHLTHVIELLAARGLNLTYARFLGDDPNLIEQAARNARSDGDLVLSCGGIGATPDDLTRQAVAVAFDLPLERHREAEALIVREYGERSFPHRVLMADFPRGAGLIPNPINRVAGFFVESQHYVPGFPEMAWPMIEWVLDSRYASLHNDRPEIEFSLRVLGSAAESDLLDTMNAILAEFPGIELSSLPSRGDGDRPRHIELGIRGREELAAQAFRSLRRRLESGRDREVELIRGP